MNKKYLITAICTSTFGILLFANIIAACGTPPDKASVGKPYFVAVADNAAEGGFSEDGIEWLYGGMNEKLKWKSVCYGNDRFVAIEMNNKAAYSLDGQNWELTDLPSPGTIWNSVCYGNGKFVATGGTSTGDNVAYSTDGINWTGTKIPHPPGDVYAASWKCVCYGKDKFVAISEDFNGPSTRTAYSLDGETWGEFVPAGISIYQNWQSICYGNGGFVAVAFSTDKAVYSDDGITWLETDMRISRNWQSVCYGKDKFVAVGLSTSSTDMTTIAYSFDGINWQSATPKSFLVAQWGSVCYGNGRFVTIATGGGISPVAHSFDGIEWALSVQSLKYEYGGTDSWQSVCYGYGADSRNLQLFASLKEKASTLLAYITGRMNDKKHL